MKIIRKIEHNTGKEFKELYREFMDLPLKLRIQIDVAVILFVLFVLVAITPGLKYNLINTLASPGVTVKVVDSKSSTPIVDTTISVNGKDFVTDKLGVAKIDNVEYGEQNFSLSKLGYETKRAKYLVSERSENLELSLDSTGKRVIIDAKQYLSKQPVRTFMVKTSGDIAQTASGIDGRAVLVIPTETQLEIAAEITADYFLPEVVNVDTSQEKSNKSVSLVPDAKHFFLANRGGTTTVYSSNFDGSNQAKFIEPTGFESPDSQLFTTPSGEFAVYKTSRRPGSMQMYLLNLRTKDIREFAATNAQLGILDVNDERVIFVADKGNPEDNQNQILQVFSFTDNKVKELFETREMQFTSITGGKIVFAEQILRNSYPGGYLLRQLLAVDEKSGDVTKLSEHATITDVKVVSPTEFQYTQINPASGVEVRLVYNTVSDDIFGLVQDEPRRQLLLSPYPDYDYAWTSDNGQLELGSIDMIPKVKHKLSSPIFQPERWATQDYIILRTEQDRLLLRIDSGQTFDLP